MLINTAEYLSVIENIKKEIKDAQYRATIHVNSDMLIAFPESKGYSVRNLKYMAKFAETYPDREFVQQVVAQIPWGHNIVLLDKVADMDERKWYIKKSAEISKFKSAPSHFQYQNHLA